MTIGMTCPACGQGGAITVDSRCGHREPSVRRRRECRHCKHRWSTYEVAAERVARIERLEALLAKVYSELHWLLK